MSLARSACSLGLALLLGGAVAALPAAGSERVEAMLGSVSAPAFEGAPNLVSFIDLAALYEENGLDVTGRTLPSILADKEASEPFIAALWRLNSPISFLSFILVDKEGWGRWYGFDMLEVEWVLEGGQPPRQLLYLGLDTTARAEAIAAALTARGMTAAEGEVPFFSKGVDGGIDVKSREPGRPFGGELGGAEFLALLPDALLGSRYGGLTETAALAPRIADNPSLAAGIRAVDSDALPGRLIQFVLIREDFAPDYVKTLLPTGQSLEEAQAQLEKQAPGPLPAFEALLFADRQDGAADELLVALVYGSAEAAAIAAETLPLRLEAYQLERHSETIGQLLGEQRTLEVVEQDGKSIVLLRVTQTPEAGEDRRALGYRLLIAGVIQRDAGWLTWKD